MLFKFDYSMGTTTQNREQLILGPGTVGEQLCHIMYEQVNHMANFLLETKESNVTLNVLQSSRGEHLFQQLPLVDSGM